MDEFMQVVSDLTNDLFGIKFEDIIMQLLVTIILIIVVRVFLWKNVTELIDKRKEALNNEVNEAKQLKGEAETLYNQREKQLSKAEADANVIVANARTAAEKESNFIIETAKLEADKKKAIANMEIELEIEKSKSEVKDAIVEIAFQTAEKIIEKEIDKDKHNELVNDYIDKAGKK